MVKLNKIYTRTGDDGTTGLGDGSRLPKHHARIAAMGDVDEANCAIGLARLETMGAADDQLARIQNELFDLGADLCLPEDPKDYPPLRILPDQVTRLEAEIDAATALLRPLTSFILPGGTRLAASLHMARAVTRRAERQVAALAAAGAKVNPEVGRYLNRLSDLLFQLGRLANHGGRGDVLWAPGAGRG